MPKAALCSDQPWRGARPEGAPVEAAPRIGAWISQLGGRAQECIEHTHGWPKSAKRGFQNAILQGPLASLPLFRQSGCPQTDCGRPGSSPCALGSQLFGINIHLQLVVPLTRGRRTVIPLTRLWLLGLTVTGDPRRKVVKRARSTLAVSPHLFESSHERFQGKHLFIPSRGRL